MSIIKGGLLDNAIKMRESRVCKNCENLIQISDVALGCAAHDKFILPNFPPYHGNMVCQDWKVKH